MVNLKACFIPYNPIKILSIFVILFYEVDMVGLFCET